MPKMVRTVGATLAAALFAAGGARAHGDVAPQPVNTDALPDVGEEWLYENPYRAMGGEVMAKAVEIGASGYTQNCARCHGLEAVSGGLAPDLRSLEAEEYGDEWFVERFRHGYTQNGVTRMPAFGELLGQKAAWAIRSYIETRPDDGEIERYGQSLGEIRDLLGALSAMVEAGDIAIEAVDVEIRTAKAVLGDIAGKIETASGAGRADSPASRAAAALAPDLDSLRTAEEILTIGLSQAQ